MSTTRRLRQLKRLPHPPGTEDCEWVSEVLRQVADTEGVRRTIMGMLAADDLWCIWRATKDGTTARDKRSHQTARLELERRGLLDSMGRPLPAAD
jgi:hypothetical protein